MDLVKEYTDSIAALRAAMVGAYLAAVLFVRDSEMPEDEQEAINLWNDALARTYVSKNKIDEAAKLIAKVETIKETGIVAAIPEWEGVFADAEMLEMEMADAIERNKKRKGQPMISDDNERSEKVWRDAVSFAVHWRIVPATGIPFNVTAKKKNQSLIALAQSVSFTKDSDKELDILRGIATAKGLNILTVEDYAKVAK